MKSIVMHPLICSNCNGPHASSAEDCSVWKKETAIQCIFLPEARQLVEPKSPSTVFSSSMSFVDVVKKKKCWQTL